MEIGKLYRLRGSTNNIGNNRRRGIIVLPVVSDAAEWFPADTIGLFLEYEEYRVESDSLMGNPLGTRLKFLIGDRLYWVHRKYVGDAV